MLTTRYSAIDGEELQPARIRGKRYRTGEQPPRKKGRSLLQSNRRKLDPTPNDDQKNKSQPQFPSTTSNPARRTLTPLESLPAEILQLIFTISLNPSLPASSLPLSKTLSSFTQLQRSLFLSAFVPSIPPTPWLPHSLHSHPHYTAAAQTLLLNQRWLTYDFIISTLGSPDQDTPQSRWPDRLLCNSRTLMPRKLLSPPWDDGKTAFLGLLLRSGANIDDVHSTDMELASSSLLQACKAGNADVVQTLVNKTYQGTCCTLYGDYRATGVRYMTTTSNDLKETGEAEGVQWEKGLRHYRAEGSWVMGVVPTTEHLRAAVLEGGCVSEVVLALCNAEGCEIDKHDPGVWRWISERKEIGIRKGEWLEKCLSQKKRLGVNGRVMDALEVNYI